MNKTTARLEVWCAKKNVVTATDTVNIGHEVGFYRNCRTGNIHASFLDTTKRPGTYGYRQEIVVQPRAFLRIAGAHPLAVAGCVYLNAAQMAELGFVLSDSKAVDAV